MTTAGAQVFPGSLRPGGPTGSINGIVRGPGGPAGRAIQVAAVRVFPLGSQLGPPVFYAFTDASGRYRLDNLPPASYRICVSPRGSGLLDPCDWAEKPPLVNLVGGQSATMNVTLEPGSWLHVRVHDPDQRANAREKGRGDRAYSVGVRATSGAYLEMAEISRDQRGRNFRVAVPRGKDITVLFYSGELEVDGPDGRPAKPDTPGTVRLGPGDQTLEFRVK
jgi:hypothetical protein